MENEWTECCNAAVLYTCIDGVFDQWDFCKICFKCGSTYTADTPRGDRNE